MQENPAHAEALVLAEALRQSVRLLIAHGACDAIQKICGMVDGSFKSFVRPIIVLGREFTQSNEVGKLRTDHDAPFLLSG
ncbi:hypothetical protein AQJ27_46625 [Streptomyces olivochromogenes]|uniref:Uncharacterized protein n=1 Tax=Streptomyces olivochromogenes TaxID=1963 RepID=A0A250VU12_STROL|nr:hypothetical protein AQJ27_46625 [Streptomyces olivochromogenes]GAX57605.1 hypothetical protein SO3561_09175 [Streptomyces olivochromogenes]